MLKSFTVPTCLAVGLAIVASQTHAQVIREGVRRTGEAVAEGGRAVAQGTRNAINRTGEATRNVIGNTADAARGSVGEMQRSGAPVQGQYQSGYRGLNDQAIAPGQASYQGRAYCLRHDRNGREFICVNGRAVYFDDQQSGRPHEAYKLSEEQMRNQGPMNYQQPGQIGNETGQQNEYGASQPPAPPVPAQSDFNSSAPAATDLNADRNISGEQRPELSESANIDSDASLDASASTDADANNANRYTDSSAGADLDTDAEISDSSTGASADTEIDADNQSDLSTSENENSEE